MSWSPEIVAYAGKKWLEGRSACEVAIDLREVFGLVKTRNAVIGVLHRNGYSSRGRHVAAKPAKLARPPKAPMVAKPRYTPPKPGPQNRPGDVFGKVSPILSPAEAEKARSEHRAYGHETVARVAKGSDVESPNARPWMERRHGECKWPLGERHAILSCCNPVERGGYCAGHAAVAFTGSQSLLQRRTERTVAYMTRFDRVEPTVRQPKAGPTSIWDEARAA